MAGVVMTASPTQLVERTMMRRIVFGSIGFKKTGTPLLACMSNKRPKQKPRQNHLTRRHEAAKKTFRITTAKDFLGLNHINSKSCFDVVFEVLFLRGFASSREKKAVVVISINRHRPEAGLRR
jgi:hypothetical protein